jgi:molybdopterin synthase catalytic subunit
MQVRVLYYGMLRDIAGRDAESVELPEGSRAGDLFALLAERLPRLQDFRGAIAMSVNLEYAEPGAALQDNDEVALVPPVSGGSPDATAPLVSEHASLVHAAIDTATIAASVRQPADGAVATFDGIVRDNSRGRRALYLDYSAYEAMALKQMEELAQRALAEFAIREVRLVHRIGRLQIGESSVFIVVAAAHRAAAFDACRWLIDTLKKTVPVWKKEYFEDGAVWADGEPFPPDVPVAGASK